MSAKQILIAIDQLVNAVLGGYADETMSSRCWRLRSRNPYKTLRPIIDVLFWFDRNHCQTSYESEKARKHSPTFAE